MQLTVYNQFDDVIKSGKKYKVLYADPPWSYENGGRSKKFTGCAVTHYDTMELDDLKKLPVDKITDENANLFCWVTFPTLLDGLDVIKSWGFTYKTLGFSCTKRTDTIVNHFLAWDLEQNQTTRYVSVP